MIPKLSKIAKEAMNIANLVKKLVIIADETSDSDYNSGEASFATFQVITKKEANESAIAKLPQKEKDIALDKVLRDIEAQKAKQVQEDAALMRQIHTKEYEALSRVIQEEANDEASARKLQEAENEALSRVTQQEANDASIAKLLQANKNEAFARNLQQQFDDEAFALQLQQEEFASCNNSFSTSYGSSCNPYDSINGQCFHYFDLVEQVA